MWNVWFRNSKYCFTKISTDDPDVMFEQIRKAFDADLSGSCFIRIPGDYTSKEMWPLWAKHIPNPTRPSVMDKQMSDGDIRTWIRIFNREYQRWMKNPTT